MLKSENKKVGILTFHHSLDNYGAVLQTYSIYQLIKKLGYEPYIINFIPKDPSFKAKVFFALKKILGFQFDLFRKKYIHNILKEVDNIDDLKELNNFLDYFVVGSDQVWRYRDNHTYLYKYFFDFVNDEKPKIAYAASFGIDQWHGNEEVTQHVSKLLNRFHSVSVREESGVDICRNIMGVEGTKVLDPTLVLDSTYFHEIANCTKLNNTSPDSYIAYMFLDEPLNQEVYFRNLAAKNNLNFIKIKGITISSKKRLYFLNSVSKWLFYIKNAEIVITDSFHCVAFSIIFRKKFICISNERTGVTRLKNLLELIGLESRLITSLSQINEDEIFANDINYDEVEKILEKERNKSIEFLKNSLI